MPADRSYPEACGIARALDVIGERCALLIVRELLFGPPYAGPSSLAGWTAAILAAGEFREA